MAQLLDKSEYELRYIQIFLTEPLIIKRPWFEEQLNSNRQALNDPISYIDLSVHYLHHLNIGFLCRLCV
jgi:hypothetical protein